MHKWIKALTGGLVLSLAVSFFGFVGTCSDIRDSVLRVHILANSDSEEDQQLKLQVRDAVVQAGADLLDGTEDQATARRLVEETLPTLCEAAQRCVWDHGYDYTVHAQLTDMYFTTRTYDSGTFPAGVYEAVRFTIGEGKGKNWWCVMYPPLCVSAATEIDEAFTDTQSDILQNGNRYRVRFKVVEWVERLLSMF